MKIPFDSLCLAAALHEMRDVIGGRLQRVQAIGDRALVLGIYANGKENGVLLSAASEYPRMHRTARQKIKAAEPTAIVSAIRRLDGARLLELRQVGFDRLAELSFGSGGREYRLIAELTGKHANLILVGPDGRVIAAAHAVGKGKSIRPIVPGATYEPPPFPPRRPVFDARSWEEFSDSEGASPFLRKLLLAQAGGDKDWPSLESRLRELGHIVREKAFQPVEATVHGVYPVSVAALGMEERAVGSYSDPADRFFQSRETEGAMEALRASLLSNLNRVLLSRELALKELDQAADAARQARRLQERAELILAYAHQATPGQTVLGTIDYEGKPIFIELDPERTPAENAQQLFDRAKHAKARGGHVEDQRRRIGQERTLLIGTIRRAEDAKDLDALREEEALAKDRRWLRIQAPPAKSAEERPYEGHRIRELVGPGGVRVLYGENATSNDYLTQRVAKPNDWWLHVRGGPSAHVVIRSENRPERIGREALEFAARVAVANSGSKHSGYVSVDYVLKKHVRKPRGAPPGTVTYSHEKTLAIEPSKGRTSSH